MQRNKRVRDTKAFWIVWATLVAHQLGDCHVFSLVDFSDAETA